MGGDMYVGTCVARSTFYPCSLKNSSKASRAAQQLMQQPIYPGRKWDRVFKIL